MWSHWISLAIGVWVFISGFFPGVQADANFFVTGIVTMIFGFMAYKTFQGIVIGIIGIWLFANGIILNIEYPANYFIFGALMVVFALWGGLTHSPETFKDQSFL